MPSASARISGGELAGRVVRVTGRTPEGFRPTSGRLREAVFNILGTAIADARVLDLFAGSGLIAFEALSRGAAMACCVESSPTLAAAIRRTAEELGVSSRITVVSASLPEALARLTGQFDIAYLDPPYAMEGTERTLDAIAPLLTSGARVVYEHSSRYNPAQRPPGLEFEQRRVYGDSAIALYHSSESQ